MTQRLCNDCPRRCNAVRGEQSGAGFCRAGLYAKVARAAPHLWEEPCISGTKGSGAVFFCGCNLGCVYCQNRAISRGDGGKTVTPEQLRGIFLRLAESGVHNLNLVTPTHYSDAILAALREGFELPVIANVGGYESVHTLRRLEKRVNVWLPDFKYALERPAARYSAAPDYPQVAKAAILEMYRATGDFVLDGNGMIRSGVIIRHLVLPGNLDNTRSVIDWVSSTFKPDAVMFSLMGQYTPPKGGCDFEELQRGVSAEEYVQALEYLENSGIEYGYTQQLDSAQEEYIPDFDLTGVE